MFHRLTLYINTVKYMKPSQIYYRIKKMLGLKCTIGCLPSEQYERITDINVPKELDFDEAFLKRFNADDILDNKVTFLHSARKINWNSKWELNEETPLWNFNLHYFEFLFPLLKAYEDTNQQKYLNKTIFCILAWIKQNPKGKGIGWAPYTLALRLTNWISYYSYVQKKIDKEFQTLILNSLYEQYKYLAEHVEKDLLGNHYFEDLKALVLGAIFFDDENMLERVLETFKKECREQILPDGMHFELSPMYHKIIFEGILRVTVALRGINRKDIEIEKYLQPMLDVAWSLEEGLERIPLFNDCGNNVAKGLDALVSVSEKYFSIIPHFKSQLKDSGFYIFKEGKWKLIVDAGQPGPKYIPGHAHCDAMSFELFRDGKPMIANCGTYAYQCEERNFFRSTAAHNTVKINGKEQSQCWGVFRLARRATVKVIEFRKNFLHILIVDQYGQELRRKLTFSEGRFELNDSSRGNYIQDFIHFVEKKADIEELIKEEEYKWQYGSQLYAPEFGDLKHIFVLKISGNNEIKISMDLKKL